MTEQNITLRENLIAADPQNVRDIVTATGFFYDYEIDVAVELAEEALSKGAAKSGYYFLMAEKDGRAVGYSCYGPIACTDHSFDLYWIAVHQEFQGLGIGKMLLKKTEEIAAAMGCRGMYVETASRPQYDPTRAFYKNNNYLIEAVLKDFYSLNDDKVIFVKRLN